MSPSSDFVPFARPCIGPEEESAVLEVLRSGWLTTGKVARAFEEEFAAFVGARRALAVNSATSGLMLALEAFGIGPGTKVATSPYTFASSAAVARRTSGRKSRSATSPRRTTTSIRSCSRASWPAIRPSRPWFPSMWADCPARWPRYSRLRAAAA